VTPSELRRRWRNGEEVALFDAREEGPFAEAHPFFAVCLPPSQVEARAYDLVPRRSAPVVVFDNGEGVAARVARRLTDLGYTDVSPLDGGLDAYAREGQLFRDVNVPSKAFGELVESTCHTPSLAASEIKKLLESGANVMVLDVRRLEEYRTMSIPTAVSVPNAELTLRVFDLVPSPDTLVVVNCAGRTRSIIGTQTLVNIGLPNRVAALRNGTIGWALEGYELDTGQTRTFPSNPDGPCDRAAAAARHWATRVGVRTIDRQTYDRWMAERDRRTLYRFDVRTPAEHAAGHPIGFLSSPGGQLVQATDEWVAVRGARLVLFDDLGVRALMTASWLVQMGWDAVVLQPDAIPADQPGIEPPNWPTLPDGGRPPWTPLQLAASEAVVVDVGPSAEYLKHHVPGAHFVLRSRLADALPDVHRANRPLVLTSPDGVLARYAAHDAADVLDGPVDVLAGGTAAWGAAGLPLESHVHSWVSPPIDHYTRPYEGTDTPRETMQGYIDWELQLVQQMQTDGISRFRVVSPEAAFSSCDADLQVKENRSRR
jgi:rhodanese-related sulfurtransferase